MTKAAELAKVGDVITNGQLSGRRNLFYNGNFQCWQRSTSETGLGASSGYFTADRWKIDIGDTSAGRFTMNRTAGDPDGFNYGLVINCTTTDTSIAAGEFLLVQQRFEGQDLQHLKKGTSGAETTILSFYAKVVGSATDIVVEVFDNDNARHICKKFTLTTEFQRYYFTIPGDTTGSLDQDNAQSMTVSFCLHSGSTYTGGTLPTSWAANSNTNRFVGVDSIFASTSNEFYLAGVQWEVGSQATPFEHRSLGEELDLCQRYYQQYNDDGSNEGYVTVGMINSDRFFGILRYVKTMRAVPTVASTGSAFKVISAANTATGYSIDEAHTPTVDSVRLRTGSNSNLSDGQGATLSWSASGNISLDSEL